MRRLLEFVPDSPFTTHGENGRTVMPKTRTIIAALVLALTGAIAGIGASPAHAEMVVKDCKWAPSGWDTAQVCVTVTYFRPTNSQYEVSRVKVEANSTGDVRRVEYSVILWNDESQSKWDRVGTLDADNGWDKVYTPNQRTSAPSSSLSCWGTVYYKESGSQAFYAGVSL